MSFNVKEIYIDSVRVVDRSREDVGDVSGLAKSIRTNGLIHAITVTEDGTLLAGQRRLEAYRLLGKTTIPAHIVSDLTPAAERLRIERDENTERMPMTPEELVRLGRKLEALEQPKAAARQAHGKTAPGRSADAPVHVTGSVETRQVVAQALGMSATTYDRAKTVVTAAEDTTASSEEQAAARAALKEMNATGNIHGAYQKVQRQRAPRLGARQRTVIGDAKKQRRAITQAAATLGGITIGLDQIEAIHPDITSEEAAQWVDDLSKARRALEVLIKRLKERTNAQA